MFLALAEYEHLTRLLRPTGDFKMDNDYHEIAMAVIDAVTWLAVLMICSPVICTIIDVVSTLIEKRRSRKTAPPEA